MTKKRTVLLICKWILLSSVIASLFVMTSAAGAQQNVPPTADFSATPTSGLEPLTVSFDDSSTSNDGISVWEWDFENDGVMDSTEQNPTHVYEQNGVYTVSLRVVEGDGDSAVEIKEDYIKVIDAEPSADFTASSRRWSLRVRFTDTSISYDEIVSWAWEFGDGRTSTNRNPTHRFPHGGTFNVDLTVTDADGSVDTITKQVNVMNQAPMADFDIISSEKPTTNEEITFVDASSDPDGNIVSWSWDFGDGKTASTQNAIHTYQAPRTYTIRLTITDDDAATDTTSKKLAISEVVNQAPMADFDIISSEKPTTNEEITFVDASSDPDGNIVSWSWDFGDGKTASTQNAIHTYQAPRTYTIRLTITDDDAATDTTSKDITIYDVAPPVTTDDYDGSWHTSDFTITLTAIDDLSGVAETYYRINEGPIQNVSNQGQPLITTEGANKQLEYWSIDNAGNEETHHIVVDIKLDKTGPTAVAGPDLAVYEDTPMTFDGSDSYDNIGITNYTWAFFDGTLQTLSGVKAPYIFHAPGAYTVNLTVSDAALNYATDTLVVNVIDVTKPIANAGDDQVVYEDVVAALDGSASIDNVEIVSYVWTFLDVTPQALLGINSTYIFEVPGVYNVTLTVSDAQGNSATDLVTITVIDATWPAANAGPDQVVDEDTPVNFDGSASTDNVEITSYVWTFTDSTLQTLFGVNPSYTFETPDVYTVTLNVTDTEGYFTTDTVVITVRDTTPPLVDTSNYQTVVENAPVNFDASESYDNVGTTHYNWDFGDGTFENSTIPSVVHIYTRPGAYKVVLTIADESGNVNSASISVVVFRDTDRDLLADYLDTDDDEDGMPDDWEILHELDPLDPSDASLDPDGDGLSNLTEYQGDSDPNGYTFSSSFPIFAVLMMATTGFIFAGIHAWLFVRILRRTSRARRLRAKL